MKYKRVLLKVSGEALSGKTPIDFEKATETALQIKALHDAGCLLGVVVGVGSIVDRTDGKIDFGVPYKAVYSADVVSWEADNCPLCRESGLPLVKPGSRKIK